MPFPRVAHTAPAETITASFASHMKTPFEFFDFNTAFGTSSHVFAPAQREAREDSLLLIIALSALMPRLLALEASEVTAVLALNLLVSLIIPRDVLLTVQIRAPDHLIVLIDLARQS